MAVFTYVARDDSGGLVEGDVTASSTSEAAKLVRAEGKWVVNLAPKGSSVVKAKRAAAEVPQQTAGSGFSMGASTHLASPVKSGDKYRPDDVLFFTNQMAVMIETGVSLAEALEGCVHDGNSPRFARALNDVIGQVNGGREFSGALADHPKVFPPMYVSLIRASEASGTMGPMMVRLAQHLEHQRDLAKKIKGALIYPAVMITFAIGVTVFLMTFVLPKFTAIYAGREDALPGITRALLGFSDILSSYGLYALGVGLVAGMGLFFYLRQETGRAMLDRFKLRVPLIGPILHKTYMARSLKTLGTMIHSGVSMLEGVKLTTNVCPSRTYQGMWQSVHERLQGGKQLSDVLSDYPFIPKAIKKMISAGERGGQLGGVLERIATHCENELSVLIKSMTGLLEPAIVMFLGTVVGGLVLALLLPIFTISKAMH